MCMSPLIPQTAPDPAKLARMAADGHFPEWSPPGLSTAQATSGTLDFFIALLGGVGRTPEQGGRAAPAGSARSAVT
mgnify:CR=1 FL=1